MTADRLQRLRKAVALDLTPLRVSRDYRLLYIGRTVSYAGSMLTTVAFPYQVYQRTHSTLAVGLPPRARSFGPPSPGTSP